MFAVDGLKPRQGRLDVLHAKSLCDLRGGLCRADPRWSPCQDHAGFVDPDLVDKISPHADCVIDQSLRNGYWFGDRQRLVVAESREPQPTPVAHITVYCRLLRLAKPRQRTGQSRMDALEPSFQGVIEAG